MSRKAVLAILMITLVGLAGCLEGYGGEPDAAPPDPPTPGAGSAGEGGGATPPPPEPSYEPPEPSPEEEPRLEATVTPSSTNGTTPLSVTFLLEGGRSDGVVVTWTFDAEGDGQIDKDGTDLPQNLTYVYDAGHHNATFRVSDDNATIEHVIEVIVMEPPVVGPPAPIWINETITGAWFPPLGYLPEAHNHSFELPVPVTNFTVRLTFDDGAVDLDYEVYAPDGREVGRQTHFNEPTGELPEPFRGPGEPAIQVRGEDAEMTGTWSVRVMPALAVDGDYTIGIRFF